MIKKTIIALAIFSAPSFGLGQDVHFAQTSQLPQLANPGLTGMFGGWERASISHRSQWGSIGSTFQTTSVNADFAVFKPDFGTKAYGAAGLNVYQDVAGDSKFRTFQASGSLSGIVPMGGGQTISAGLQIGMIQRSVNFDNLVWGNQFNNVDGFDPNLPSNEGAGIASKVAMDASAGVVYTFGSTTRSIQRNDIAEGQIGVAIFHITQPDIAFPDRAAENLYRKIVVHARFQYDIPQSMVSLVPHGAFFAQGPYKEVLYGGMVKFRLKEGTKYTGINTEASISLGITMRAKDAVIPTMFLEFSSFKIGFSYDVNTSDLSEVSLYKGGFEVSLQWANMKTALFKKRTSKGYKKVGGGA